VTDLRDQLADFEAAARPIPITRHQNLGALLRRLRHQAGLSLDQLAAITHVSKSGLTKREQRGGITVGALVDHARHLGYDVALVPQRRPGVRETGTGWPA